MYNKVLKYQTRRKKYSNIDIYLRQKSKRGVKNPSSGFGEASLDNAAVLVSIGAFF